MGYFVITNFKDLGACYNWMVKPNFDPRRAGFGKLLADRGLAAAGSERCEPAARAEGNFSGKAEPRQGQYEPLGMGRLPC